MKIVPFTIETQGALGDQTTKIKELRFDVAPLPLLAALAPDVVAHLGTTSKILTPTLGAGWMVAPPSVTTAVLEYRERTGTRPSPAGQRVLVELARNGDLGRHLV